MDLPDAARDETRRYHRDLFAACAPDPGGWAARPSPHVLRAIDAVHGLRTAVDLGCGDGRHALPLAEAVGPGGRVVAVDLLPDALDRLVARATTAGLAGRIEPLEADLEHLDLGEATADLVLACSALEHVSSPTALDVVLARIARAVSPGGIACLLVLADRREVLPDGTVRPALVELPLAGTEAAAAVDRAFDGWERVEHSAGVQRADETRADEAYVLEGRMLRWTLRRPAPDQPTGTYSTASTRTTDVVAAPPEVA